MSKKAVVKGVLHFLTARGKSKETDDAKRCFVFEHMSDENLKSYVFVQKGGTVLYNKAATSCNYEVAGA